MLKWLVVGLYYWIILLGSKRVLMKLLSIFSSKENSTQKISTIIAKHNTVLPILHSRQLPPEPSIVYLMWASPTSSIVDKWSHSVLVGPGIEPGSARSCYRPSSDDLVLEATSTTGWVVRYVAATDSFHLGVI